ncbi:MAG: MarR family transcriptional regulator [Saprospiraceae bacterium]
MEQLNDIIFYTIDKAIRTYRQYAQKELKKEGFSITIDQWLIIKNILEYPEISQQELSEKVFKDNASVTRIIDLLVKANYLERNIRSSDRRRTKLKVTSIGKKIIIDVHKIILKNRSTALNGLSANAIEKMKTSLQEIIKNCSK